VDRETCADCGKEAPQTETNYTLISAQFGWRLTRSKGPTGELVVEWRCPSCWREYKRQRPGTITGSGVGVPEDRASVPPQAPGAPEGPAKTPVGGPPLRVANPTAAKPPPRSPSQSPPAPAKRPSVPARRRPT
jgi:hypothetical protein